MNVLHIIPSIEPLAGGPSTAVVGLAEAQHRAGLMVRVLTCAPPDSDTRLIDRLRASGIQTTTLGGQGGVLSCPPAIRESLQQQIAKADIVHIHALWEPLQHYAAVESRRQGKPYLFRPCGMLDPWSLAQSRLKKKLYLMLRLRQDLNAAAAMHFTAQRERDVVAPLGLKPQTLVVPNGIDLDEFSELPAPGEFRKTVPGLGNDRFFLFLSRLHYKKGVDALIRAFAKANLLNTRLVIAGTGDAPYVEELKRIAQACGKAQRIHFVGMLHGDQKLAAYQDAELFVLLSKQENFGNVVVESLACGTPVLLSDQVAICSEIRSAGVGWTAVKSERSYAEWLEYTANTSHWGTDIAERCRALVASQYDWNAIARTWQSHYADLASQDAVRRAR